ncbi:MAG: aminomethyltransferase family protein [Pseudomonadota bacterium]
MISSDGATRDLVTTQPGQGWDFGLDRHPYHEIERPLDPHYCVYNRRLMAVCFDALDTNEMYWQLRTKAAVLHTGEWPIEFRGPDAETLLNLLFTKDVSKVRPGRCGYGLACFDDGGLITDGVFLRLDEDRFWYAQADGDFVNWARAHAKGMNVEISDPGVYVSQVQGPTSLDVLADAAAGGLPEAFGYFGIARVNLGGQDVVITRTGYTNELGWEYYTEPHHDAQALWTHLETAGKKHGMSIFGLDSMNIRRIEAGIMNAGSDFDSTTNPYEVGFARFVDMDKDDFLGKAALETASKARRSYGIVCPAAEPKVNGRVRLQGAHAGKVTCGAHSPFLGHGIGMVLLDKGDVQVGAAVEIEDRGGRFHPATLVDLPLYDKACEIPRGKMVDIPQRPA